MNNNARNAAIIAVAVIVVAALATILVTSDNGNGPGTSDERTYSIDYVLNGGTIDGEYPTTYTEGKPIELTSPTKEGYVFSRWYTDADLTEYFEGITEDTKGDLVLYAAWSETLDGHGFTLKIAGEVSNGPFNKYRISGAASYRYLYYDEVNDRYYMNLVQELEYDYGITSYTSSSDKNYWSDESSDEYTEEYLYDQTIDTVNGKEECHVFRLTYNDGSTETQWIGDEWIPYYIEYIENGVFSSAKITYTFVEELKFTPDIQCDVIAYADDGITVSGDGVFNPGEKVVLTASGSGFSGWYDESWNLISDKSTYSFTAGGSDTVLFALNDTNPDVTAQKDVTITLSSGTDLDSASWTVMDITGRVISTTDTVTLSYTFDSAGEYLILMDGKTGEVQTHRMWNVAVEGDTTLTYTWVYGGKTYTTTLDIDYADYKYYKELTPVSERCQETTHVRDKQFVTYEDKYILQLASKFKTMTSGMTDLQVSNFVLAFTQYIEYQSDDVFTGYEEYWKYPVETLYDQGGDCEDTSILFSAIAEAMGYNTCLLLFPGHMAAGIDLDINPSQGMYYFSTGGYNFYYGETTATGYTIGAKPSNVSNTATVVKICSNQ